MTWPGSASSAPSVYLCPFSIHLQCTKLITDLVPTEDYDLSYFQVYVNCPSSGMPSPILLLLATFIHSVTLLVANLGNQALRCVPEKEALE